MRAVKIEPSDSRRPRWLPAFGWVVLFCLLLPGVSAAMGRVGARYGWSDASGDIFTGSGDLGGTDLIGLQLSLDLLALLEVEAAGEYVSEEFEFTDGVFQATKAAGRGDYEDFTFFLSAKLDLLELPLFPLKGYVGGGLNVHWIDVTVNEVASQLRPVAAARITDELEDAIKDVTGDSSEIGWHAALGVRLAVPGGPVSLFVEGRYMEGLDDTVPTSKSLYAGFTLGL